VLRLKLLHPNDERAAQLLATTQQCSLRTILGLVLHMHEVAVQRRAKRAPLQYVATALEFLQDTTSKPRVPGQPKHSTHSSGLVTPTHDMHRYPELATLRHIKYQA
jgi:hypothetical protein